jgi:long-chain fatty acid transport protein
MQNAFTAFADDASAVFYNPAGLVNVVDSEVVASAILVAPSISYVAPGAEAVRSTEKGAGVSIFASYRLDENWVSGVGIFAPAARVTDYPSVPQLGNASQSSKILRIDLALSFARAWGPIAVGFGPVLSAARYESSVLGFDEKANGTGATGYLGLQAVVSPNIYAGIAYRAPISLRLKGTGTLPVVGSGSFTATQKYPGVVVGGISWIAEDRRSRIELDVEYQNWNSVKSFNRAYDNPILNVIGTTHLNAKDALVYRLGTAAGISANGELRAGLSYTEAAVTAEQLIPSQPDFAILAGSIGYGHRIGRLQVNIAPRPSRRFLERIACAPRRSWWGFPTSTSAYDASVALNERSPYERQRILWQRPLRARSEA